MLQHLNQLKKAHGRQSCCIHLRKEFQGKRNCVAIVDLLEQFAPLGQDATRICQAAHIGVVENVTAQLSIGFVKQTIEVQVVVLASLIAACAAAVAGCCCLLLWLRLCVF